MCGIVGGVGTLARRPGTFAAALDRLRHRGPDDHGLWHEAGVTLGHTRLSIIDLSPAGHQPMQSAQGSHVIVFNGEIYNHQDLRGRLKGESWQGHSDTESLLAGIAAWGVERTLQACNGMFAFAVWDRRSHTLTLARDRLGEKPLYYGYIGDSFVFASELKALSCLPGFNRDIDRDAMAIQLRHGAIPAPYCIYKGIAKLSPGCWLALTKEDLTLRRMPEPFCYWSAAKVAVEGLATPMHFSSDNDATDALEYELQRAVSGQMLADVPVGAFLSGGIDSSTMVALMQASGGTQVHTFSIGFREPRYDEAVYAKSVANHLGTQHTEMYVSATEARAVIPELPTLYDEPFSDPSQIPTVLLSRLARTQITVALSGDGGDELFAGYTRYAQAERLWARIERLPRWLRQLAARAVPWLPTQAWDSLFAGVAPLLPARYRWSMPGDKLHKGAALLRAANGVELYRELISNADPAGLVLGASEATTALTRQLPALPSLTERMLLLDIQHYLPDILLVKLDRAAMSASLETRVPMLDHRVFEFAWRLPLHYKQRGGQGKWLLRRVLHRHVPPALVDRPKMGFGVPIDIWLRGPLRDWAESLLEEARLRHEGFFDPAPIRLKWQEHLSGRRNWHNHLWDVLMFQAWLEAQNA